ncbi:MAG: hypothetical protein MUF31_04665 [Akkermansiaceae bacterium]|nr:hypothetical protein [Akkermansiaceae bacterium]
MKNIATTLVPAFATLALFSCENPADKTTDAKVTEAAPAAATAGTKYVLAESSTVGFTGSKVTGSHRILHRGRGRQRQRRNDRHRCELRLLR